MEINVEVEKEVEEEGEKEVLMSPPAEKVNGRMDMFFTKVNILNQNRTTKMLRMIPIRHTEIKNAILVANQFFTI